MRAKRRDGQVEEGQESSVFVEVSLRCDVDVVLTPLAFTDGR